MSVMEKVDAAQKRSQPTSVAVATYEKFSEDKTTSLAAMIAFWAFFSIFPLMMVLVRRARRMSMLPAMALSCFLASAIAWPFARTGPLTHMPMLHLMLFGVAQLGLGLLLLTLGMRRVSATRAALIGLIDTPLAPVWVWIAFNEAPPAQTLGGGGIVMCAVLWNMRSAAGPG